MGTKYKIVTITRWKINCWGALEAMLHNDYVPIYSEPKSKKDRFQDKQFFRGLKHNKK